MAQKLGIYKCELCGNIVEVLDSGAGQLVCCGEPMKLLEARSVDTGSEKHVPVIEKTADGVLVKVGAVAHPMEDDHYIEWIELECEHCVCRKFLAPGQAPEALFPGCDCGELKAREYCNKHGLWRND